MNERYIKVIWPEIQDYMDHPRYKECYIAQSLDSDIIMSEYMVPEDLYFEIINNKYINYDI